jgi:iron complex transport system substrate-binding protein
MGNRSIKKRILVLSLFLSFSTILYAGGRGESGKPDGRTGATEAREGEMSSAANIGKSWNMSGEGSDRSIQDAFGNTIEVKRYNRIIALSAGAVESIYMIGGEERLTAIIESSAPINPVEKTSKLPTVGTVVRVSMEHLLMHAPDLVLVDPMNPEISNTLLSHGIPSLVYNPVSVEDILSHVEYLGVLTGSEEKAGLLALSLRKKVEDIQSAGSDGKLRGLFIYTAQPMQAFSSDSLAGDILRTLGVKNLADGLTGARPIVSSEFLIAQDPDFIWGAMSINSVKDILEADTAVANTRAGREGNIEIIPAVMIMRASPHLLEQIPELGNKLPSARGK